MIKGPVSMNWLWYTISGCFLVIGILSLIILFVILKRRASNGFWSRENEVMNDTSKNKKKKTSKLCCSASANEEDLIDATKSNFNLELKQCNIRSVDRYHHGNGGALNSGGDEYSTNSLYGTIDRLIVRKQQVSGLVGSGQQMMVPSAATSATSSASSSHSAIICTNNFNSITKDPRLRNSPATYVVNTETEGFEKTEIHF